jgi:hypothetical protein
VMTVPATTGWPEVLIWKVPEPLKLMGRPLAAGC